MKHEHVDYLNYQILYLGWKVDSHNHVSTHLSTQVNMQNCIHVQYFGSFSAQHPVLHG